MSFGEVVAVSVWRRRSGDNQRTSYDSRMLSLVPKAYYRLGDAIGSVVAADSSGNSYNATAAAVTFGVQGAVYGDLAASFDGASSTINCPAGLYAATTPNKLWCAGFFKVSGAAVWLDGVSRYILRYYVDVNNYIHIYKSITNNTIGVDYKAGGTLKQKTVTINSTGFVHFVLTVADAVNGDALSLYINGTLQSPSITGNGTWVGVPTLIRFGYNFAATNVWSGTLDELAIGNGSLTTNQILSIAR